MAHAETCPVCSGSGKKHKEIPGNCVTVSCHGCGGKGWVEVGPDDPIQPWPWWIPKTWPPYIEPTSPPTYIGTPPR